jgi:predicted molibdopterin-dependent oxidoreductase YjgC
LSLPLLERAKAQNDPLFRLAPATCRVGVEPGLIPGRAPSPGEQYRFHFEMACNEQNGNPGYINWRRVGEIEGGTYPFTQRLHVSMGCNHCVDGACLKGCPVNTPTSELADLVLPAAIWGEKEGTYTNSERRVSKADAAVAPPGEALPDLEIFLRVAEKLGVREELFPNWTGPRNAFEEWKRVSQGRLCAIAAP